MVLHLADEVRFLVAPVLAGAAVGGEDEPVRVRVDDFMDVVAPPVAFLLLVLFLRLVAVEGDQRHAQLIHDLDGGREIPLAVQALEAGFQIDNGDDALVQKRPDARPPFALKLLARIFDLDGLLGAGGDVRGDEYRQKNPPCGTERHGVELPANMRPISRGIL